MSLDHYFFSSSESPKSLHTFEKKAGLANGDSNNNDVFHALATGIIELFCRHPLLKLWEGLLDKLVTRFEALFSGRSHENLPNTSASRMQQIMKRVPMQQFISELAFTLRQIAVDELCINPEIYPSAFIGVSKDTSPEIMRRTDTSLDASSIAALSNSLGLPITVNVVERGKILPKQLYYNVDKLSTRPCVLIKLESRHFTPMQPPKTMPAHKDDLAFNRSMPEILGIIADDQLRIKHKYDSVRQHLEAFVLLDPEEGVLNKADLIAIYVKWINSTEYLSGQKCYAGTEYGYQHFFEAINDDDKMLPNHNGYITQELINAIARAITIGHMHPDVIYKDNQYERFVAKKTL